jgi:hypothetical protein
MPFGTNPVITTTYAGEFAGKYLAAALLSAPTLEQGRSINTSERCF